MFIDVKIKFLLFLLFCEILKHFLSYLEYFKLCLISH